MSSKDFLETERQPPPAEDSNHAVTGDGGEKKKNQIAAMPGSKRRVEQAEARAEHAEARTELAKTRAESAETRAEQAETRTEQAKTRTDQAEVRTEQAETRTEQAETRTEQAETALAQVVHPEVESRQEIPTQLHREFPVNGAADQNSPLEVLTVRQREILQLIAEGQNTKQIAEILKVSPKTVEYHRMKLMAGLNLHDVPGLVRYALRVGLISQES